MDCNFQGDLPVSFQGETPWDDNQLLLPDSFENGCNFQGDFPESCQGDTWDANQLPLLDVFENDWSSMDADTWGMDMACPWRACRGAPSTTTFLTRSFLSSSDRGTEGMNYDNDVVDKTAYLAPSPCFDTKEQPSAQWRTNPRHVDSPTQYSLHTSMKNLQVFPPPISTVSQSKSAAKPKKPRVRCPQPGCKVTFARKYDLQRHQTTVHDLEFSVLCSVYGCNRAAKPLPRVDKFNEHMRKHDNAHQFLCIIEDCRAGPMSREELLDHLNNSHILKEVKQANLEILLGAFKWRQTPLSSGLILAEDRSNCPLAFLGCNFQPSNGDLSYSRPFHGHLQTHEISERSRGYEAIVRVHSYWPWGGLATCPICQTMVCNQYGFIDAFIHHVADHSKEERVAHAIELAEIFRPFLTKKEPWGYLNEKEGEEIEEDLKEAGLFTSNN